MDEDEDEPAPRTREGSIIHADGHTFAAAAYNVQANAVADGEFEFIFSESDSNLWFPDGCKAPHGVNWLTTPCGQLRIVELPQGAEPGRSLRCSMPTLHAELVAEPHAISRSDMDFVEFEVTQEELGGLCVLVQHEMGRLRVRLPEGAAAGSRMRCLVPWRIPAWCV